MFFQIYADLHASKRTRDISSLTSAHLENIYIIVDRVALMSLRKFAYGSVLVQKRSVVARMSVSEQLCESRRWQCEAGHHM